MPQSSRLKSANAPSPRHFYFSRRRPWREGRARAHGLDDHHSNHSEVSHHLQNLDLHSHYQLAPKLKALDLYFPTFHVKVHHTLTSIAPDYPHRRVHLNYPRSTHHPHQRSSSNMRNVYNLYHHDRSARTNFLQSDPAQLLHQRSHLHRDETSRKQQHVLNKAMTGQTLAHTCLKLNVYSHTSLFSTKMELQNGFIVTLRLNLQPLHSNYVRSCIT